MPDAQRAGRARARAPSVPRWGRLGRARTFVDSHLVAARFSTACHSTNRKRALFPGDRAAPGCAGGNVRTGRRSPSATPAADGGQRQHDRGRGDQHAAPTVVRGTRECQSHQPTVPASVSAGVDVAEEPHRRPEQRSAAPGRPAAAIAVARGHPGQRDVQRDARPGGAARCGPRVTRRRRSETPAAGASHAHGTREQPADDRLVNDVADTAVCSQHGQRPRAPMSGIERTGTGTCSRRRARSERVAPDIRRGGRSRSD